MLTVVMLGVHLVVAQQEPAPFNFSEDATEDAPPKTEPEPDDIPVYERPKTAPSTTPTTAPAAPDPALLDDPAFAEGMRFYNTLEFEKAAFRFRSATRATGRAPVVIARAYLWLGLSLAQADDELSAREAFAEARALDASVKLPPDAPPTVRPLFDNALSSPRAAHGAGTGAGNGDGLAFSTLAGGAVVVAGALAVAGGGALGALAYSQADAAQQERFQSDAIAAHEQAEGTALLATTLVLAGAGAAVAGAGVVVVGSLME